MRKLKFLLATALFTVLSAAQAQTTQKVVDIPSRPGVTQRVMVLSPPEPKAAVILFAGGHGGLQIFPNGSMKWGEGNFLVRSRQLFADAGLVVAVIDAPSDRQSPPFLGGFRQTPEHTADVKAVIGWLRQNAKVRVWLVGTSRGTQSAAYVATELPAPEGPDGLVLTSTVLTDTRGNRPVPAMPLGRIRVPVLVVHHEQDGCALCAFSEIPGLMGKLANAPKTQLLSFKGGANTGDPCEAFAYHGFNGLEREVVQQIAAWILANKP
ncbi:MAG: alpha/beta hydrolase [Burkholderiales bacterium]|nr:alpha/beta hydrolase [Burkholderiales bacterium]